MQATAKLVRYSDSSERPVTIEVLLRGKGPLIILLPSLGRGAADFDDLAGRIAAAGYRTAAINPRGIGGSQGPKAPTFAETAGDVREVIRALQSGQSVAKPVVLVGHAYGNRLARAVATWHPDAVSGLILLASGGQVAIPPAIAKALRDVFDPALPPEAHIAAVRTAFFCAGQRPRSLARGLVRRCRPGATERLSRTIAPGLDRRRPDKHVHHTGRTGFTGGAGQCRSAAVCLSGPGRGRFFTKCRTCNAPRTAGTACRTYTQPACGNDKARETRSFVRQYLDALGSAATCSMPIRHCGATSGARHPPATGPQ